MRGFVSVTAAGCCAALQHRCNLRFIDRCRVEGKREDAGAEHRPAPRMWAPVLRRSRSGGGTTPLRRRRRAAVKSALAHPGGGQATRSPPYPLSLEPHSPHGAGRRIGRRAMNQP